MPSSSEATAVLLREAIEALPEALAIFDRDGRFVAWNTRFAETYGEGVEIEAGLAFADHLRRSVALGHVPDALGREDAWIAERLERFTRAEGVHQHQLGNGIWVRVQDRALPSGGRVGIRTDVTDLVAREQSFRLLFEANPMPMFVFDRATLAILAVNDAAVRFYGYDRDAFLRLTLVDLRQEDHPGEVAGLLARLGADVVQRRQVRHRLASGAIKVVEVTGGLLRHEGSEAVLLAVSDLTEQHHMENEVRSTWEFLKQLVDTIPVAVFAKDMWRDGRYVVFNRASEQLFGCDARTLLGRTPMELFPPDCAAKILAQDQEAVRFGTAEALEEEVCQSVNGESRLIRTRKVALSDAPDTPSRFVLGVAEDVTEQRASLSRIAHRAHHDALTDLPNRFLFEDRLSSALGQTRQSGALLALMFLDLDGFKLINDAWGHLAGDLTLKAVAARLRGLAGSTDTVARLGGDEFAILQSPLARPRDAETLAARIIAAMAAPFTVRDRPVSLGISVGIALAPAHGLDAVMLLDRADAALYQAKRGGRGTFRVAA